MKYKIMLLVLLLIPLGLAADTETVELSILIDADYVYNTTDVYVWTDADNSPKLCESPSCNIEVFSSENKDCNYTEVLDAILANSELISSDIQNISTQVTLISSNLSSVNGNQLTQEQLNSRLDLVLSDMGIQTNQQLEDFNVRLDKTLVKANETQALELDKTKLQGQYDVCASSLADKNKRIDDYEDAEKGTQYLIGFLMLVIVILAIMVTSAGTPIRRFLNLG